MPIITKLSVGTIVPIPTLLLVESTNNVLISTVKSPVRVKSTPVAPAVNVDCVPSSTTESSRTPAPVTLTGTFEVPFQP